MTKFTNLEKFEAWVKAVMKSEYYDLDAVLEELEESYGCNASAHYEMGSSFTKSRKPEVYYFDVIDTFYLDGVEITQDDINDGVEPDEYDREYIF